MIELELTNRTLSIKGASRSAIRAIDSATSYMVAGHQFSQAFRQHHWDGKEHLLRFSKKQGYSVPAGLIAKVMLALREEKLKFRVIDRTRVRHPRRVLKWNPELPLRDYQLGAIRAAIRGKPIAGLGILKMPIRSGKTRTAARLISVFGRPTLFLVPSKMLLRQTVKVLEHALPDTPIGIIGDGEFNPQFVTVSTIQSLDRMRGRRGGPKGKGHPPDPRYVALLRAFDVLIADECHHFSGEGQWYKVLLDFDARFKIGLSATAFPESESERERGIIWMLGVLGPILCEVGVSELVEAGHLMRQHVRMYRVMRPRGLKSARWSHTLRVRAIEQNKDRNRLIVRLAAEEVADGAKVLIVANRLSHIATLTDLMDEEGLDYRVIVGKDDSESRASKVEGLESGEYNVLIGTVLSEGVDIPCINCVINAEGGARPIQAVQRQRNLTVANGKKAAVFIDFYDMMNPYFKRHSRARLEAYVSEESYRVKLVKNANVGRCTT
jgi:superfamily II DNA or RNA helicase